jgi:hypothetical protein
MDVEDVLLITACQRVSQDKIGKVGDIEGNFASNYRQYGSGKSRDVSGVPKVGRLSVFQLLTFEALNIVSTFVAEQH